MAENYVRLLIAAVLITATMAKSSEAQDGRSKNIYISGGIYQAAGKLGDQVETGYGGSLGFGLTPRSLSNGQIELVVRGQFDYFPTSLVGGGPDVTFINSGLELKLNRTGKSENNFYFLVGLGLSYTRWGSYETFGLGFEKQSFEEIEEYNPYLAPGIGIEYTRWSLSPFVELRLMVIAGDLVNDIYFVRAVGGLKL